MSTAHVAAVGIAPMRVGAARRTLDITVALVVLVASAPLLVGIAVALKLSGGGPVLFRGA